MRRVTLLLALGLFGLPGPAPLPAQRDAPLTVTVAPPGASSGASEPPGASAAASGGAPVVTTSNVLADRNLRDLLANGFPARLHYRIELWEGGGLFDHLRQHVEWDVVVRYDPLLHRYSAARIEGDRVTSLGSFGGLDGVVQAVGRPFRLALQPGPGRGTYYYVATLDVAMLSVTDLDEVERWLRGEAGPTMRGERNPGTALSRGALTLMTRLLGGERRHYEARSPRFRR